MHEALIYVMTEPTVPPPFPIVQSRGHLRKVARWSFQELLEVFFVVFDVSQRRRMGVNWCCWKQIWRWLFRQIKSECGRWVQWHPIWDRWLTGQSITCWQQVERLEVMKNLTFLFIKCFPHYKWNMVRIWIFDLFLVKSSFKNWYFSKTITTSTLIGF